MGKLIFILGGARSGKSSYAIKLAKSVSEDVCFIATAAALDKEMKRRIKLHKASRPRHWKTIEEEINLIGVFNKLKHNYDVVILDCLTLFISNLLMQKIKPNDIEREISQLLKVIKQSKHTTIIISNEVGLGIVPENKLAREFRDIAGRANQLVAGVSNEVYFIISGVVMKIKEC